MTKKTDPVAAEPGFEEALDTLETLVEKLESEQLGLADSMQVFEQGMGLARRCQTLLDEARQKVELLSADGEVSEFHSDDADPA
ncbi:MAG: hypothetical protein Tsb002_28450 [Wenzhouxiangellaceae bacterium]